MVATKLNVQAWETRVDPVATYVEEWTDPAAADVDAIKTSFSSAASEQAFTTADFDGAVGAGAMSPPRNITITTSASADIDAVGVAVTGTDIDGNALSETITLTNDGGTTDSGAKAFATVETITIPAQTGTGGSIQIGFGDLIGFAKPIASHAGTPLVLAEIAAGSLVATGTFAGQSTGAPNGTYSPNTAADGSNDYAVTYAIDLSAV